jgi:NAD+ synthase
LRNIPSRGPAVGCGRAAAIHGRDRERPTCAMRRWPMADGTPGQTDEAEMGFTYDMLEKFLSGGAAAVPAEVAARIERLRETSDHKREPPRTP